MRDKFVFFVVNISIFFFLTYQVSLTFTQTRIKTLNYWNAGGTEEAYKQLRCTGPQLSLET